MKNSAQGNEESESIVLKPKRDKAFILLYLSHHRVVDGSMLDYRPGKQIERDSGHTGSTTMIYDIHRIPAPEHHV